MNYLFDHLDKIKQQLTESDGQLLMLDFDGTLSPLAESPTKAVLPKKVKQDLQKYSKRFPVAIVSGRALGDIRAKIGLKNLTYSGNHGLELQTGNKIVLAPGA